MLENIPTERVADGFNRLFFGPVYLMSEVVSTVFPGAAFFLLLLLKRNKLILSLFTQTYTGYHTKILVALFVAYVFGKILAIPREIIGGREQSKLKKPEGPEESARVAKSVIISSLVAGGLYGKHRGMDYITMVNAQVYFYQSCGNGLVVASFVRGDGGGLRLLEAGIGLLMLLAGRYKFTESEQTTHHFIGIGFAELAANVPKEHWLTLTKFIGAIFPTPQSTPLPVKEVPKESVSETPNLPASQ